MAFKIGDLVIVSIILQYGVIQGVNSFNITYPVKLDTKIDFNEPWKAVVVPSQESCFYGTSLHDLYHGWGCGGGPETFNRSGTDRGYWTACNIPFCRLPFYAENFTAFSVSIKGIVKGEAKISVLIKSDLESEEYVSVKNITSGATDLFNGEATIDLSEFVPKVVEVRLHSPMGQGQGYVFLDQIMLRNATGIEKDLENSSSTITSSILTITSMLLMAILIVII